MKENKLIKLLIPIVAIVVVFESVMLVSNLDKESPNLDKQEDKNLITEQKEAEEPVASFVWETEKLEMEVDKSYKVTLNLLAKSDLVLDGVETHIYYDPKEVSISNLKTNEQIGEELKPTGINNDKGFVTAILWKDVGEDGFETKSDDMVEVLSFMVTPKVEGQVDLDLSTSMTDTKLATILVESGTNKPLTYLTNQLEIMAIK